MVVAFWKVRTELLSKGFFFFFFSFFGNVLISYSPVFGGTVSTVAFLYLLQSSMLLDLYFLLCTPCIHGSYIGQMVS